nr:hypothetical protein [Pseudomonas syringae pv. actinidiae]
MAFESANRYNLASFESFRAGNFRRGHKEFPGRKLKGRKSFRPGNSNLA